jgi:hypothetical protein
MWAPHYGPSFSVRCSIALLLVLDYWPTGMALAALVQLACH